LSRSPFREERRTASEVGGRQPRSLVKRVDVRFLHTLKHIYEATVSLVKQARLLPEWVETAVKQRRQQIALQRFEAERLDRKRNPSKYLGK